MHYLKHGYLLDAELFRHREIVVLAVSTLAK